MQKYQKLHTSIADATSDSYVAPALVYVEEGNSNRTLVNGSTLDKKLRLVGSTIETLHWENVPLFFTAEEAGSTIQMAQDGTDESSYDLQISTDGENWSSYTLGTVITLSNVGDKVYWRGNNDHFGKDFDNFKYFVMSGKISASGNINSLLNANDYDSITTIPSSYCYTNMFCNCTSLTSAPELPATTLTYGCYGGMFCYCDELKSAPELPATILSDYCYSSMFYECEKLNYIKCLATDISAEGCTEEWVTDVATMGTFVKAEEMEDWTLGDNGIPVLWNSLQPNTVDLGLPSGILWGSCNIGAKSLSDAGGFFSWGDSKGFKYIFTDVKEGFSYTLGEDKWYTLTNGSSTVYVPSGLKSIGIGCKVYASKDTTTSVIGRISFMDESTISYGTTEQDIPLGTPFTQSEYAERAEGNLITTIIVQGSSNDAARKILGDKWSVPTSVQCNELIDGTTTEYTCIDGVWCVKFVSKTNGNYIVVPISGYDQTRMDGDNIMLHTTDLRDVYSYPFAIFCFDTSIYPMAHTSSGGVDWDKRCGANIRPVYIP